MSTEAQRIVIAGSLTPEDSKRIADAAIEAIQDAGRRFDAMCANIEQQIYIKNNPTKW